MDGVLLCTAWEHHIDLCIDFMKAGKYVGCEVGGAYSVRDCWKLVETYEETKVPVMLMENCIYGRDRDDGGKYGAAGCDGKNRSLRGRLSP